MVGRIKQVAHTVNTIYRPVLVLHTDPLGSTHVDLSIKPSALKREHKFKFTML